MRMLLSLALLAGSLAAPAFADVPAEAPVGSTGMCKDGTYSTAASKSGACSGHHGVKTWYVASTSTIASKPAPASIPTAADNASQRPPSPVTPATVAAAPTVPATSVKPAPTAQRAPVATPVAAGGGPGQVWVNTSTKVYHCSGDRYYGKTKTGVYMSESDAQAKGYRGDHGKACAAV